MKDCECLARCPFFNDELMGAASIKEMIKAQYCNRDNSGCARFMIFKTLGRSFVPFDLNPIDLRRAEELIAAAQNTVMDPSV